MSFVTLSHCQHDCVTAVHFPLPAPACLPTYLPACLPASACLPHMPPMHHVCTRLQIRELQSTSRTSVSLYCERPRQVPKSQVVAQSRLRICIRLRIRQVSTRTLIAGVLTCNQQKLNHADIGQFTVQQYSNPSPRLALIEGFHFTTE